MRLLSLASSDRLHRAALLIYVLGVVGTLLASGLMHMAARETALRDTLVRIDHAAIFFLIAATFTPVHIIELRRWGRWGLLLVIWSAAIAGMALKLFFFDAVAGRLSLSLYLSLGWMGILSACLLYGRLGFAPLIPIALGALAYTAGALLDFSALNAPLPGYVRSHELFHLFVLAGVGCHWVYISGAARGAQVARPARCPAILISSVPATRRPPRPPAAPG